MLRSPSHFAPVVILLAIAGTALAEVPWPAEALNSAVNLTAIEGPGVNDFHTDLSGAFWNSTTRRLWVVRNGPWWAESKLWAIRENGQGGFEIDYQNGLRGEWTAFGDLEAVTQANLSELTVYLMIEGEEKIKEYDVSTYGIAILRNSWNTTPHLPLDGGNGAEGIAFVPDSYLVAAGFVDQNGNPYVSQNGMGGLMFVAHQNGGRIYAFDLNRTNATFAFVGAYQTNFWESCELSFDRTDGRLYILHGANWNRIEVTNLSSYVVGGERRFNELITYGPTPGQPSGWNLEGLAIMPNTDCSSNNRKAFLAVDGGGANSLLMFQQFPCNCAVLDDDGDGVGNCTDQCPNTPAGQLVFPDGCSCQQLGMSAPTIQSHPVSVTTCGSLSQSFCVTASGTNPLTYQWQRNGVNIAGATSSCYSTNVAGSYRCTVSNSCGSALSNSAVLIVSLPVTWYRDIDGDGFGNPALTQSQCSQPAGYVSNGLDCNDSNPLIHPFGIDTCSEDRNCDGLTLPALTWYRDNDGDGFGDPEVTQRDCAQPEGFVANGQDCDDANPTVYPNAPEINDGLDNDCDGLIDEDGDPGETNQPPDSDGICNIPPDENDPDCPPTGGDPTPFGDDPSTPLAGLGDSDQLAARPPCGADAVAPVTFTLFPLSSLGLFVPRRKCTRRRSAARP